MEVAVGVGLGGVIVLVLGLIQMAIPLDNRWERHERYLQRQGLEPVRTQQWEDGQQRGNVALLVTGAIFLFIALLIGLSNQSSQQSHSQSRPSPLTIDGRNMSQADYDQCGPNPPVTCPPDILKKYSR